MEYTSRGRAINPVCNRSSERQEHFSESLGIGEIQLVGDSSLRLGFYSYVCAVSAVTLRVRDVMTSGFTTSRIVGLGYITYTSDCMKSLGAMSRGIVGLVVIGARLV